MKARRTILTLVLFLALLLPSCGRRTLDPETLALAEASDAVCMGKVETWEWVLSAQTTKAKLTT